MRQKGLQRPLGIHQRRYLGNKRQLLDFIHEVVTEQVGEVSSIADLFAGTGVVGHSFNKPGVKIIANELLYANYCSLDAFLGAGALDPQEYVERLRELNDCSADKDSYLVKAYGDRYFGLRDAAKMGAIRERIKTMNVEGRMRSALIASLLYSADRIANTCGHYDAFRSKTPDDNLFHLYPLSIPKKNDNKGNEIHNKDVLSLVEGLSCQIAYLDPPYNSRQYCDAYHVLENIARWEKPPLVGKAKKFDRRFLKSLFNLKEAASAFEKLIDKLRCPYVLVSYSNMEGKGDARSRNRISGKELIDTLSKRGSVDVFERPFKAFSAGKSVVLDHAERLYLCRIDQADGGRLS